MNGFINVDKEEGVSSAKEVARIKKLTGERCGHMGTLDPMATGVLPVAVGNAARLFDYFSDKKKKYIAEFKFGCDSDTLDTTGQITKSGQRVPTLSEVAAATENFVGKIEQIPPKYSAKNVNGRRGYELARRGIDFELPPKTVEIYSFRCLGVKDTDTFGFEIECGGGTYIRSLARDLAKTLSTCAVMSSLRRVQSGVFSEENAVKTCKLTCENLSGYLIKTQDVLSFAEFYADNTDTKKLLNGLSVPTSYADGIYKFFCSDGSFYGLAEAKNKFMKVKTKLC